jgi:hypothetical protein
MKIGENVYEIRKMLLYNNMKSINFQAPITGGFYISLQCSWIWMNSCINTQL